VKRLLLIALLAALAAPLAAQVKTYPYRWVFVIRSLRADKDLDEIREIARVAAAHGETYQELRIEPEVHPAAQDLVGHLENDTKIVTQKTTSALFSMPLSENRGSQAKPGEMV